MGVVKQALNIFQANKDWRKGKRGNKTRRQAQQLPVYIPPPTPPKKDNKILYASIIGLTLIGAYLLSKKT